MPPPCVRAVDDLTDGGAVPDVVSVEGDVLDTCSLYGDDGDCEGDDDGDDGSEGEEGEEEVEEVDGEEAGDGGNLDTTL